MCALTEFQVYFHRLAGFKIQGGWVRAGGYLLMAALFPGGITKWAHAVQAVEEVWCTRSSTVRGKLGRRQKRLWQTPSVMVCLAQRSRSHVIWSRAPQGRNVHMDHTSGCLEMCVVWSRVWLRVEKWGRACLGLFAVWLDCTGIWSFFTCCRMPLPGPNNPGLVFNLTVQSSVHFGGR